MTRRKVCVKDINIAAHGITALNTHAKWLKHKKRLPNVDSQSFFKNNEVAERNASAKQPESSCQQFSVDSSTNRTLVINAKIMWDLDIIMLKYSLNSCSNKNELFATMFSDGEAAKAFSCGKTKYSKLW